MPFKNLPDNRLIQHCREGNDKAFNELFRRYFNKLHQFSLKFVKDESVAEELVLDLLLKVWQKTDLIQTDGEIAPYLFKAMKNTLFNHIRKREIPTIALDLLPEHCAIGPAADEAVESRELNDIYRTMLEQLSPQRKKVFQMSREHDMTHKEIAAELQLSVNTVENHIGASLSFLRRNLKKYSDVAFALIFGYLL